jgi:CHAT domain-containing protein/Tfp pilus assembly protein PilF
MFKEVVARSKGVVRLATVFLSLLVSLCGQSVTTKPHPELCSQQSTPELRPGMHLDDCISGKQKRTYEIEISQGQYASLELNVNGLRASIGLFDPSGSLLVEYNLNQSPRAQQTLEFVAEATGRYRLQVESNSTNDRGQPYMIEFAEFHSASERELQIYRAQRFHFQARQLNDAQKYDDALALEGKALTLREQLFGAEHGAVADALRQMAQIYAAKAEYPRAEAAYLRALSIREKVSGPNSDEVFELSNNLGAMYFNMGELDKAEHFMEQARDLQQNLSGAEDLMKARVLNNLALVYYGKSDFDRAAPLFEHALAIEEQKFGPAGLELTSTLDNLSVLYQAKGDYLKAESFARRSLAIEEKFLKPEDPDLGSTLLNLGNVRYLLSELDQAETLYQRALAIYEKALGPEHPLVALALNNLAEVFHDRHEFAKAEPLYLRSLQIRGQKLGAAHSDVGQSLNNLGTLYRDEGDYVRADQFYRRALKIRENALGANHPDVVSTLSNISLMYMASGDFLKAEDFLAQAIAISERNASLNLMIGSERQKRAYLDLMSEQLDRAISLSVSFAPEQAAARDLAVTTTLQRKGRIQDALSDSFASLRKRVSAEDLKLLDQFNQTIADMSRLVLAGPQNLTPEEFRKRVAALNQEREEIEAEVSRHSAEFRAQSTAVTLNKIQAALPDQAALIEFVAYKPVLARGVTVKERYGKPRYVVYVIRKNSAVSWKELGDANAIDEEIEKLRQALRDPQRQDVHQIARTVYEQLMRPIRPLLDDATQLLISPDGELNLIPFGALVDEQRRYLIERYSLSYLTTGRELLRMHEARESRSKPTVFANPSFGELREESTAKTKSAMRTDAGKMGRRSITAGKDLSEVYFAPLSGTGEEARSIQAIFPDAIVFSENQATESALKQVVAPRILHIATHGFFLQNNDSLSDNPLLRSGLALSGANVRTSGSDDGILTALEASGLNLWGTKLVVLSACDTGVGEVRNGEGVYGLRRAFVLAGAESLVMSLWPISDYTARQLMTGYYRNLKQGLGRGEALRQVQLDMLKKNSKLHPFYWANFIQAGDWTNLDGKR